MSISGYLPENLNKALVRGRAIPLLVNYRPAELPDHQLTVVGLLEDRRFEGVFLPDSYAGEELVSMPVATSGGSQVPELKLDSPDAEAVHELWSRWHDGVREDYIRFAQVIAMTVAIASLTEQLLAAEPAVPVNNTSSEKRKPKAKPNKKHAKVSQSRKSRPS